MFVWTWRQVIWFFVLFVVFAVLLVQPENSASHIWFKRMLPIVAIVKAVLALRYVMRK